ncbi:selenoneine biosynthesis selenosugar synthase SenB [Actinomadura rupiterrae]|uniref:selenoneine biosynthesis selenosugar synthase SenB n=1 Tax=Actinomadura rupiterrae TaxID=559627 RepID=UPI0020A56B5E|nr:selenoneine biosynthesis selenosugar synthase SenB [Actinomadura rupiterrae]MCP2341756.1 putative glycosyltransferase (TIGR04348 family) [Actinomadura rupiterrae]
MILLATPTAPGSTHGNGVSTRRWTRILEDLGHTVEVAEDYRAGDHAMLLAMHARRGAAAVRAFRADHPRAPIVLALTGTDLYPDFSGIDRAMLALTDRLIVLQPHGLVQVGPDLAGRTRVIVQSVPAIERRPPRGDCFEVAFLAHARPVKDPLRLPEATRLLPPGSRIRVTHVGRTRAPELAGVLTAETAANPRYDWLGPVGREQALAVLARSRLMALTSLHEGGANVISEALAARVPIIASHIPSSVGLLGETYPGYFPPGDTAALAELLYQAEHDSDFYAALADHCAALAPMVDPARERQAFASLLKELNVTPH